MKCKKILNAFFFVITIISTAPSQSALSNECDEMAYGSTYAARCSWGSKINLYERRTGITEAEYERCKGVERSTYSSCLTTNLHQNNGKTEAEVKAMCRAVAALELESCLS